MQKIKSLSLSALGLIIAFSLLSCGKKDEASHEASCNKKWQSIHEKYLKGKYGSVVEPYSQLLTTCAGFGFIEQAWFEMATAQFYLKNYVEAELEFRQFIRDFPQADSIDYAAFRYAMSISKQSPIIARAQDKTHEAVGAFQEFLLNYPNSSLRDSAKTEVAKLKEKLVEKEMYIAHTYEKLEEPQAANIYYQQLLEEYPETSNTTLVKKSILNNYLKLNQFESARELLAQLSSAENKIPQTDSLSISQKIDLAEKTYQHKRKKQKEKKNKSDFF